MNISCDMGEPVSGIGYQFYSRDGLLGTRVTADITNPLPGIYAAIAQPPNGTIGIIWNDAGGTRTAVASIPPVVAEDDSEPFETARQLIYQRFLAGWDNIFPVSFEGQSANEESGTWGRLSISYGSTDEPTCARKFTRTNGIAFLSVFVRKEEGTKPFNQAGDRIRRILARARLSADNVKVRMTTVTIIDVGNRDTYRQKNVACNFILDCYDTP